MSWMMSVDPITNIIFKKTILTTIYENKALENVDRVSQIPIIVFNIPPEKNKYNERHSLGRRLVPEKALLKKILDIYEKPGEDIKMPQIRKIKNVKKMFFPAERRYVPKKFLIDDLL